MGNLCGILLYCPNCILIQIRKFLGYRSIEASSSIHYSNEGNKQSTEMEIVDNSWNNWNDDSVKIAIESHPALSSSIKSFSSNNNVPIISSNNNTSQTTSSDVFGYNPPLLTTEADVDVFAEAGLSSKITFSSKTPVTSANSNSNNMRTSHPSKLSFNNLISDVESVNASGWADEIALTSDRRKGIQPLKTNKKLVTSIISD